MKTSTSYRKQIREIMLNKMSDCDEQIDKLTVESKAILNSDYLNFPRIAEICRHVETALCKRELLKELIKVKKTKGAMENSLSVNTGPL
ncbi:MAG: hypothetical protein M1445_04230 [Bacteroidetes bacterium]|nr:hypothetical protein [Bacteroidota bacterium]MCL6103692.1 hypothetical protein [Bacteroidota bacterium]